MRLQSHLWGSYCCNLEMKSDKKCKNCDANEQLLNGKCIVKSPPHFLTNTAHSSFDGCGKVIKTQADIPLVLHFGRYLTSHYDCQTETSTYVLNGSVNYKENLPHISLPHMSFFHSNKVYCFESKLFQF